jgi:hypothetical protein
MQSQTRAQLKSLISNQKRYAHKNNVNLWNMESQFSTNQMLNYKIEKKKVIIQNEGKK